MQQTQSTTDTKSKHTLGEDIAIALDYWGLGWGVNSALGVLSAEFAFNRAGNPLYNTVKFLMEKAGGGVDNIFHNIDKLLHDGKLTEALEQISTQLSDNDAIKILQEGTYKEAFYKLHQELGGYEGIASHLGEELDAEQVKKVADFMIKKQTSKEFFEKVAVLATLCLGGYLVMLPMKAMEDNKRDIAEFIDNNVVDPVAGLIGKGAKTEEEKAEIKQLRQQRYAEIEQEEKPSIGDLLWSRTLALLPLYTLHLAWWNENNALKYAGGLTTGQEITNPDPNVGFGGMGHYAKKAGDFLGEKIYNNMSDGAKQVSSNLAPEISKIKDHDFSANKAWFSEKMEWAMTDVLYSLVAATGTYVFTKIAGEKKEEKAKQKPEAVIAENEHNGFLKNTQKLEYAIT